MGIATTFDDDFLESREGLVDQLLHHLPLFRRNLVRLPLSAEHVLELAALVDFGLQPDLVHQPAIIPGVHDHSNAAGQRQFVRHDPAGGGRNVIAARSRQVAHRSNDRFA